MGLEIDDPESVPLEGRVLAGTLVLGGGLYSREGPIGDRVGDVVASDGLLTPRTASVEGYPRVGLLNSLLLPVFGRV